jgi:hypothetical protein
MNMKSDSQRSEKCCKYQLVDEFMFNRANVVSHTYANAVNVDGLKSTTTLYTNNGVEKWEDHMKIAEIKAQERHFHRTLHM